MQFTDTQIIDGPDIKRVYAKAGVLDCDLAFANLISWGDSYPSQISRIGDGIVIKVCLDEEIGYISTLPLGVDFSAGLLEIIETDAAKYGDTLKLLLPNASNIESLRRQYPDYGFYFLRSHSDYIYDREALATLHGSRYQTKRNHLNKFRSSYAFTYSELTSGDKDECLELLHRWRMQRLSVGDIPDSFVCELDKEELSIRRSFDNFNALSIIGGVIRVDGKIVAFSYGSAISDDMFCVHIEKADEAYEGIFAAINQQLAEHLPSDFKYVNRENDLGLQGLRRAKESYHPVRILNKYLARRLTPLMQQIRALWLDCFVNDTVLDAEQFLLTRFREDNMLSRFEDGKLVSMLHIIPFGSSAYIYAVATSPEYRHHGIAASLIKDALESCKSKGFLEAVLVPDNDNAAHWYEGMGFSGKHPVTFNTRDEFDFFAICDDYDYGKCDGTTDFAMICPLSQDAPQRSSVDPIVLSDLF